MPQYKETLLYNNPLQCPQDIANFIAEGSLQTDFDEGYLRIKSLLSPALEQQANYVFWCEKEFSQNVKICWDFKPLHERGLAMLFWSAKAQDGSDIFAPHLAKRTGDYCHYHHGDINAYHLSYYRRKEPDERIFHTCNLRKSYGLHLVAQGADPIPEANEANTFYHMCLTQFENKINFYINDLPILQYIDDGTKGNILTGGHIGFRQLAPFEGAYKNLQVYQLTEK